MVLRDLKTGARRELAVDGIFVAIGRHRPTRPLSEGSARAGPQRYIIRCWQRAACLSVFAGLGTYIPGGVYQARIMHGRRVGLIAAIDAERYIGRDPGRGGHRCGRMSTSAHDTLKYTCRYVDQAMAGAREKGPQDDCGHRPDRCFGPRRFRVFDLPAACPVYRCIVEDATKTGRMVCAVADLWVRCGFVRGARRSERATAARVGSKGGLRRDQHDAV